MRGPAGAESRLCCCRIAGQLAQVEQKVDSADPATAQLLSESTQAWLQRPAEANGAHANGVQVAGKQSRTGQPLHTLDEAKPG